MISPRKSIHPACLLLLLLLAIRQADAQSTLTVGESTFRENGLVEYMVGDLPVIITAPHGGRQAPKSIADRTSGTLLTDANTDLLAKDIAEAFHQRTGRHAHVILCHLKRTKVDCNRDIKEAAQGDPAAQRVWHAFHKLTDEACQAVTSTTGKGFYIDLHGQSHPERYVELGYLLTNSQLRKGDKELASLVDRTSIRDLAERSETPFLELLRGETSLGGLLQKQGYPSVPSPAHPDAGDARFLSGGYNTRRYGSRDGGPISGVQIECPRIGVRDTPANRKTFAKALANAVAEYWTVHFQPIPDATATIQQ